LAEIHLILLLEAIVAYGSFDWFILGDRGIAIFLVVVVQIAFIQIYDCRLYDMKF
jgi:hypothetical protein